MASITLRWDDDGQAAEFARLARERREAGYLSDSDGDGLRALIAAAHVTEGLGIAGKFVSVSPDGE